MSEENNKVPILSLDEHLEFMKEEIGDILGSLEHCRNMRQSYDEDVKKWEQKLRVAQSVVLTLKKEQ